MPRLHLVRHGRAAAGWDTDPDPPLDELGRAQAMAVAERLAPLGPLAVVTSPFRRCQETAAPLASIWGGRPAVLAAVGEIPSPEGVSMADRVDWLRTAMTGRWRDLGARYTAYRDDVVAAVCSLTVDTVVFSHFIAINTVIGAGCGRDELVLHSLDNCSVTVVEVTDGDITLIEAGQEADTLIR